MAPNLDKVEVLRCRWVNSYRPFKKVWKIFKNVIDIIIIIMSRLTFTFGVILMIFGEK